jgi:hypothetical protein
MDGVYDQNLDASTESFLHQSIPLKIRTERESCVQPCGVPVNKSLLSRTDVLSALLILLCTAISIVAVEVNTVAANLGLTTQLVVVGLMLSLMAFCTQRQLRLLLITLEARFGTSTLQNYDAILSESIFSSRTSTWLRLCLAIQLATPLGLSAAYKQFIGGSARIPMSGSTGMNYALAGPVGMDGLAATSTGTALFYNATMPIFRSMRQESEAPSRNETFGFNLARISENKTAMLDGPLPAYLLRHQQEMRTGESRELVASVNAIISSFNSSTPSTYRKEGRLGVYADANVYSGCVLSLLTSELDSSLIYLAVIPESAYDTGFNESGAVGISSRRGTCKGRWTISQASASLQAAWDCDDAPRTALDEKLILNNQMELKMTYPKALIDFLNNDTVVQRGEAGEAGVIPPDVISLFVSTTATMIWSRSVAMVGHQYNFDGTGLSVKPEEVERWDGLKYVTTDEVYANIPTLLPVWLLILVLFIQPLLFFSALALRMFLFATPVGEGFGLIAMLAGTDSASADLLHGAAFSGELSKPLNVAIRVVGDHVSYVFQSRSWQGNDRVSEHVKYS